MEESPAPRGTPDSALRPAGSDLHPADHADDLTRDATGGGAPSAEGAGWPTEDAADGEALGADLPDTPWPDTPSPDTPWPDTPSPDTPAPDGPAPDGPWRGDTVPGDGTVEPGRIAPEADALRTAEYGRESEEATAVTSDSAPRPTETPVE